MLSLRLGFGTFVFSKGSPFSGGGGGWRNGRTRPLEIEGIRFLGVGQSGAGTRLCPDVKYGLAAVVTSLLQAFVLLVGQQMLSDVGGCRSGY